MLQNVILCYGHSYDCIRLHQVYVFHVMLHVQASTEPATGYQKNACLRLTDCYAVWIDKYSPMFIRTDVCSTWAQSTHCYVAILAFSVAELNMETVHVTSPEIRDTFNVVSCILSAAIISPRSSFQRVFYTWALFLKIYLLFCFFFPFSPCICPFL